jgi:hypothetical protein
MLSRLAALFVVFVVPPPAMRLKKRERLRKFASLRAERLLKNYIVKLWTWRQRRIIAEFTAQRRGDRGPDHDE